MAAVAHSLKVLEVEHYTESYFRFRLERPEAFRFVSGQFVMVGLAVDDAPVMRAYSIASGYWDEALEFYSIIIPDGALTSRLQHIKVGDYVSLGAKAVGTLTLRPLRPGGRRLYMLSTGTGIAPFISVIRDDETYEAYDEVILTQTCRYRTDLQFAEQQIAKAMACPLVGEEAQKKLRLYSSVTREPHTHEGRITHLIESGKLFEDLGVPAFDPETDRVMICGSMAMLKDIRALLDSAGFFKGSRHQGADYVWEKAFAG
jgi:ferredoxin--NADP+ reductase